MRNAIQMLKTEHREVEELFAAFDHAADNEARRKLFAHIADALAVHAAIEEKHFYPAVKAKATGDLLQQAVEEHLEIKRLIAELLVLDAADDSFTPKLKVLRENVERHVEEEEEELFPAVERIFAAVDLETIAAEMEQTEGELLEAGSTARI